jgi:SAM-dependent methyltransferase
MTTESEKVFERYEKRKVSELVTKNLNNFYFNHFAQTERELKYTEILNKRYQKLDSVKLIEIGAGVGTNLFFFKKLGLKWDNIFANELLPDRIEILKKTFPNISIYEGDACLIDENETNIFDVVFQSTVFTSLLDYNFKVKLADKMWHLTKPGGFILWYDFAFDNPKNTDVKGIKRNEIIRLFPNAKNINFHRVTLAPPIGRKVNKLYPFVNIFPFLRTHIIAEIEKK